MKLSVKEIGKKIEEIDAQIVALKSLGFDVRLESSFSRMLVVNSATNQAISPYLTYPELFEWLDGFTTAVRMGAAQKPKEREYTEEQEAQLGEKLAEIFMLKINKKTTRYSLGAGYCDKTVLGLFRTVRGIGQYIERGEFK